jgi:cGMP-dependent 3',5'-cyclic phosphodiesterase
MWPYCHREQPLVYSPLTPANHCRRKACFIYFSHHVAEVIGVAQLCNKKNGAYFTVFDVEIAKAFSVYCCISIVHVSIQGVTQKGILLIY